MDKNDAYNRIVRIINKALGLNYYYCCTHFRSEIKSSFEFYFSPQKMSSYSIQDYDNGFYYGNLYNGKRSGYGCYVWNDGSLYLGEWSDSHKSGEGIYIGGNGYVYIGMYKDGEKNGHGCEHCLDGLEIEGDFEHGKRITVMNASNSFTDNVTKKHYSKATNSYEKETGCGAIILVIIVIVIILKCCS